MRTSVFILNLKLYIEVNNCTTSCLPNSPISYYIDAQYSFSKMDYFLKSNGAFIIVTVIHSVTTLMPEFRE